MIKLTDILKSVTKGHGPAVNPSLFYVIHNKEERGTAGKNCLWETAQDSLTPPAQLGSRCQAQIIHKNRYYKLNIIHSIGAKQ
jgi:hypothetical protein